MYAKINKHSGKDQFGSKHTTRKAVLEDKAHHFEDSRPEALQLKKIQENASRNSGGATDFQLKNESLAHSVIQEKPSSESSSNAPVQLMPDWIAKLISMASENKIQSVAAVGVGVAGILLYYYFRGKPNVPPVIKEKVKGPPDFSTLSSLAETIGADPKELKDQLENGGGKITVNDLYKFGFDPSKTAATGVVPPSLTVNLPENEDAKFAELLQRFHQFKFNYIGNTATGASGFLSRQGDCATLVDMFLLATKAAGIDGVEVDTDEVPLLVPAAPIHGRNAQSNVDGIACWVFHNHFWCVYKGQAYDLLFMNNGPKPVSHRIATHKYNEISYSIFDNGKGIIDANMFNALSTDLTNGKEGYVFASEEEVRLYIDKYKGKK